MKIMLLSEDAKPISGFPGYTVSKRGIIHNNGKTIKAHPDKDGYLKVSLYKNGERSNKYVHKLVASAFLPGGRVNTLVGHKDGDKKHNIPSNLEYQSHSKNTKSAYSMGLAKGLKGSDNGKSKLSKREADAIRNSDKSLSVLAKRYDITPAQVSFIKNKKRRKGGV